MDANKDYYATLGLTPSADAVVIRAAYKALAQRYHPDRSGVNQAQAGARMAEINEAYSVLSEPAKRAEYDRLRKNTTQNADTAFSDGDAEPAASSPLDEDWQTAILFYPELEDIRAGLARISWKLAEAFRARLLSSKEFQTARKIANGLEREFLTIYFGSNGQILQFAKELITSNLKRPARELNRAVKVLGDTADAEAIIRTIRDKHGIVPLGEVSQPHKDSGSTRHHKPEHSIYGITARGYARANNQQLGDVIKDIQSGRIRGRWVKGDYYVDIGFNKQRDESADDLAPSRGKPFVLDEAKIQKALLKQSKGDKSGGFSAHVARNWGWYAVAALILLGLLGQEPSTPSSDSKSYQVPASPQPAYVRPNAAPNGQPWPNSAGYVAGYPRLHSEGRSVVTVENSRNASDVFVKLVSLDDIQPYLVRQFYIPAFGKFTLNTVSPGRYDIRYRDLSQGALSRSEAFTLEEKPTYNGTQYSNITITLYKVQNGNMQTYSLTEAEF